MTFGDHHCVFRSAGMSRIGFLSCHFAAFRSLGRPPSPALHLLHDQARWGGPASNMRTSPAVTPPPESCPASGVFCTWPASLGLEVCGEEGDPSKGTKEQCRQREPPLEEASIGKTQGTIQGRSGQGVGGAGIKEGN